MRFSIKIFLLFIFTASLLNNVIAASYSKSVNKPLALTIDSVVSTDIITCKGAAEGIITIYHSGGTAPYTYSVDGGVTYQASNVFTGLLAGGYTVIVKDLYNTVSDYAYINDRPQIIYTQEDYTNVTGCYGNNTGSITQEASGGTGVFTYSIDGGATYFNNAGVFTNLTAGTYSLSAQDSYGCTVAGSNITLTQPAELLITKESKTDIQGCYGDENGIIDITVSGGTSPIYYSIDNGATYTLGHYFSGLPIGTYNIAVRDINGCTTLGSEITLTQPDQINIISESFTDVNTCFDDNTGTITVNAGGGTGNIYYSIDGGSLYYLSGNFNSLYAGDYDIVVRDDNFCMLTGSTITLSQPTKLQILSETQQNVETCFGESTGQIVVTAGGGTAPLNYSIDDGTIYQLSGTFNNLPYGTYSVRVTDANGCTKAGNSHFITQPTQLSIYKADRTNVSTCFGGTNGTITISAIGGTSPLEYSVDGGATFSSSSLITGLSAGSYFAMARDANLCEAYFSTEIIITEPEAVVITAENPTNPSCFGDIDGQIEILAQGGTGTLQYSVNAGANFYIDNVITGLIAGVTYNIAVKDANGCTVSGSSIVLSQPDELIIDSTQVFPVSSCNGGSNGEIIIYAQGGTAPLQFSIDGGATYSLNNIFSALSAGTYWIMVKDSKECLKVGENYTLAQPTTFEITNEIYTNIEACNGSSTATITINAEGGTEPYSFSIDNGNTFISNFGYFTLLPAGTYTLAAKDNNGCLDYGSTVIIIEPDILVPELLSKTDILCFGNNNGTITLDATGGQSPYRYSIDGGVTYDFSTFYGNLSPGTYQTYVIDHFDCVQIGPEVTIVEPEQIVIQSVDYTDVQQCYGARNGTISIAVTGGNPPYKYSINNGLNYYDNPNFINLGAGNYSVKVRDSNSCIQSWPVIIELTQPPQMNISSVVKIDISCYGDNNGSITVNAAGGTGNILYSINNGTDYFDNGGVFTNLGPGLYFPRIIDDNLCEISSDQVSIYEPSLLQISNAVLTDERCIGQNNGKITFYAGGGIPEYQYSADGVNYQSYFIVEGLTPGFYTPYVRDANLCVTFGEPVEIGSPVSAALFTNDVDTGCSPLPVQFTKLNNGVSYFWDFGDGSTTHTNEPLHTFINTSENPITYLVETHAHSTTGCSDTAFGQITVYPQPNIDFTVTPDTAYFPLPTANISVTGITSAYTNFLWDFGDGQSSTQQVVTSHVYDTCGTYYINYSADNQWCSNLKSRKFVVAARQPIAEFDVDAQNGCFPHALNIRDFSINGLMYNWTFGDGTSSQEYNPSHTYETEGNYKLSLKLQGYCGLQDTKDTIINVWPTPDINFNVAPDTVMATQTPIHGYNFTTGENNEYLWNFGDGNTSTEETPLYYYKTPGEYIVTLYVTSKNGCIDSLSSLEYVYVLPYGRIFFPNAFTPNNDGHNDTFGPDVYESIKQYELKIFNRGSELVFYSTDLNYRWDGKFKGVPVVQDVYVWKAVGKYKNGEIFVEVGNVTILK